MLLSSGKRSKCDLDAKTNSYTISYTNREPKMLQGVFSTHAILLPYRKYGVDNIVIAVAVSSAVTDGKACLFIEDWGNVTIHLRNKEKLVRRIWLGLLVRQSKG